MGELLTPKTNFDFETIDKGDYQFAVKETGVDPAKAGSETGKRFWARCVVVGGGQDGLSHLESFVEKSKNHFSLVKLAGFMTKIGKLKGTVDSDVFSTNEFEEQWLKNVKGREFGAKIGWRYDKKNDPEKENPFSEMKIYYTLDEIKGILAKQGSGSSAGAAAKDAPSPAAPTTSVFD